MALKSMLKFANVVLKFLLEFGLYYHCFSLTIDKCRLLICCWILFKIFLFMNMKLFLLLLFDSILWSIWNLLYIVYWIQIQCFSLYFNTIPIFYSITMNRVLEQTVHLHIYNPLLPWRWLWKINPSSFFQAYLSKYLVEYERVKNYNTLNMNKLNITNGVLWWILC